MKKKLVKHGNSWALIIDRPILELLGLDPARELELETDGSRLIIHAAVDRAEDEAFVEALNFTLEHYDEALRELAR